MQEFYDAFFEIFPYFYEAPLAYILTAVIFTTSLIGFYNKTFYNVLIYHPYEVLRGKRLHTVFTSFLIHRNWKHLLWNLLVIFGLTYDLMGVFQQEYSTTYSYLLYLFLGIIGVIVPNLLMGLKHKQDFKYTSVGASGLSFALIGATGMFYPLQEMGNSLVIPMQLAYQYWIVLFVIFSLLTFRKSKVNHVLHLSAFLLASFYMITLRPIVLNQIIDHLKEIIK